MFPFASDVWPEQLAFAATNVELARGSNLRIFPIRSGRSRKFPWKLLSLFENSVNGWPLWNVVMTLACQPSVTFFMIRLPRKGLSIGSSQLPLNTKRCVASKSARPWSKLGSNGSVYVDDRVRKPEVKSVVFDKVYAARKDNPWP